MNLIIAVIIGAAGAEVGVLSHSAAVGAGTILVQFAVWVIAARGGSRRKAADARPAPSASTAGEQYPNDDWLCR